MTEAGSERQRQARKGSDGLKIALVRWGMSMAFPRMTWAIQGAKLGNYVPIPV